MRCGWLSPAGLLLIAASAIGAPQPAAIEADPLLADHLDLIAAPSDLRLAAFAKGLYQPHGQTVLQVIGDSINAPNRPTSMQIGYRDRWEVPYNGWVVHADSGNIDIGYMNAQGPMDTNEVRDPGAWFANDLHAISPVRTRESIWNGDVPWGGTLSDCYILNSQLWNMRLGNPFASSAIVDARVIMYEGPAQMAGFVAVGVRGGNDYSSGAYTRPEPVSNGIVWIDRVTGPGLNNPGIRLRSDPLTSESTAGANSLLLLGARFRARIHDGVQMQFIAHGGWTAADHLDQDKFTDEALRQYYAATDPPTHALLWVGQNQTPQESQGFQAGNPSVYKHDIEKVIQRHEAAIAALGAPPPRWLLVATYKAGYPRHTLELLARSLYQISRERPNVSFLNLYTLTGGEQFDPSWLADGVHPTPEGAMYLASVMNSRMKMVVGCPADFDRSGFVDVEDFGAFVDAFDAGDASSDMDDSGFVDFEDFSTFVELFEQGC